MESVILAAGEGSRLERESDHLPKLFVEIDGEPLYVHQLQAIDEYSDQVTFMLGHGFEDNSSPEQAFDIPGNISADIEFKILPEWSAYENAYTTLRALEEVDNHVLLICGDVIFSEEVVQNLVTPFQETYESDEKNVVGALKEIQDEMTAVQTGPSGEITSYGAIEGFQEVGLFLLHQSYVQPSISILQKNLDYWFPIIFEKTPSSVVFVDENKRHEINNSTHLTEARNKFELLRNKR